MKILRLFPGVLILLGMLFPASVLSQKNIETEIAGRAASFFDNYPEEHLYLHVSKPHYLAGETIWFRIFHYSNKDLRPFQLSKVAYVELVDQDGNTYLQTRVPIADRGGEGYLELPADFNSGHYRIRAYTNWMRNFSENLFAHQLLTIINPFKRLDLESPEDSLAVHIQFFPEGGYLVDGVRTRIGFKATDYTGLGTQIRGVLAGRRGDTIKFTSDKYGIGSFTMIPEAGTAYRATLNQDQRRLQNTSFPEVRKVGYSLFAKKEPSGYQITASLKGISGLAGQRLYLSLMARDKFLDVQTKLVRGENAVFTIPEDKLQPGINQFTLFNGNGEPVCERLVFRFPDKMLAIKGEMSKSVYDFREKITVSVKTLDTDTTVDMSISVFRKLPGITDYRTDILPHAYLTSELKGFVQDPAGYFAANAKADGRIDALMLTHGWRRYDWDLLSDVRPPEFIPEFHDHIMDFSVARNDNGKPAAGETVYLSVPDNYARLYLTQVNNEGRAVFQVDDLTGSQTLVVQGDPRDSVSLDIQFQTHFDSRFASFAPLHFYLPETTGPELIKQNISNQVNNIFKTGSRADDDQVTESFYGIPDASYLLDDYTRFPVMEEVMREYVYSVFVRKQKGEFVFRVVDKPRNVAMMEQPLILLDGVPVFDTDEVMQLDPLDVWKIETMTRRYFYGPRMFQGIVSYFSYDTDLAGYELDEGVLEMNYRGLQEKKEFYSPSHEVKESRHPDFRNQLFWSSEYVAGATGEASFSFYTSDTEGDYIIDIQAICHDGAVGSWQLPFSVTGK